MSVRPVVLLSALLLSGCAGRRIERENAAALATADARVLEGCYDCLLEARQTYARIAGIESGGVAAGRKGLTRLGDTALVRLFETELLLTVRAKELALSWERPFERARALVERLPASIDAERLVQAVDAVLPDGTGRMSDWPVALRRRLAPFAEKVPAEVKWLETATLQPHVRRYLALALDCSYGARTLAATAQPGSRRRRPVLAPDSPPIVIYRTGICLGADTNMLAGVLAVVPAFHEAAYHHATASAFSIDGDGGARAAKMLAQARSRFPTATGVAWMSGWLSEQVGDCGRALAFFDSTIAIDSTHELAWLQRTICLSRLHRDTAAIASATHLIGLEPRQKPTALYWRAISWLRLKRLDSARADIDVAKSLSQTPDVLTVAGVIENEQGDLAVAEQDLRSALAAVRGDENCTAAWTLGLVLAKGVRHREAAGLFEDTMRCYDIKLSDIQYAIRRAVERTNAANTDFMRRRVASLEADSVDNRTRYFASAFNGAGNHANAGNLTRARELLDVAAGDQKLAREVAALRSAIASLK